MSFNLTDFKARVIQPARPTLFRAQVTLPGTSIPDFEFICQATTVPGVQNGPFPIFYQGRQIQYAGDKQYKSWTCDVINEEGNTTRGRFEEWFEQINGTRTGVRAGNFGDALSYKGTADLQQFTQTGDEPPESYYRLEGLFPTTLGEMALDWKQIDQYQTFEVTFSIDWWSNINSGGIT